MPFPFLPIVEVWISRSHLPPCWTATLDTKYTGLHGCIINITSWRYFSYVWRRWEENLKNFIIYFLCSVYIAYKVTAICWLNFSTKSFRHLGVQCIMLYKAFTFIRENRVQEIWVVVLQCLSKSKQWQWFNDMQRYPLDTEPLFIITAYNIMLDILL